MADATWGILFNWYLSAPEPVVLISVNFVDLIKKCPALGEMFLFEYAKLKYFFMEYTGRLLTISKTSVIAKYSLS